MSILDKFSCTELDFAQPEKVWSVFKRVPELGEHIRKELGFLKQFDDQFETKFPYQKFWSFGDFKNFSRPDRHVRAFYLNLEHIGEKGFLAIKGSEAICSNFETLITRLESMWSVLTWSIGGPERQICDDISLMDQLERFPVAEGKPPGVHPLPDALEEAKTSAEFQLEHLKAYGTLAKVPLPLTVVKWPDDVRDRVWGQLKNKLSKKAKQIVESELSTGIASYVYYYPTLPIRVMHLRIPDASSTPSGIPFSRRLEMLSSHSDIRTTIEGWISVAASMISLGFVPIDPANIGRGNCLMPQNLVLDGGIVDLDSIRHVETFKNSASLEFALQKCTRVLSQAISWYLVGTSAGLTRFERMFSDVYAYVWSAIRSKLHSRKLHPRLTEILQGDSDIESMLAYFGRQLGLGQFRPGDEESKNFKHAGD